MIRSLRAFLALSLVLGLTVPAFSDDTGTSTSGSLDDLFDELESTVVVKHSTPAVKVADTDRPMFLYFGTLETQGIAAGGWTNEELTNTSTSLWYYLHLQGGIDVLPIPEARLIGTFSTYLPQDMDSTILTTLATGNTQTSVPGSTVTDVTTGSVLSVDSLYLDYSILNSAMFRVGKYVVTWGQGRIFNPGNLVSATSGGVNLRGFVPLGPVSVTAIAIADQDFFATASKPRTDELGYATNLEWTLGPFAGGFSGYHQLAYGSTVDVALRSSLFGFDVYSESLGFTRYGDRWYPSLLAGTYKEFDLGFKLRVAAEYWLNGKGLEVPAQNLGVAATTTSFIPGLDMKLSAKWMHSLTDSSGQLVAGFTASPFPKMDIALGIPWTYGPSTGTYVTGNSDPEGRVLAAMLSVTIKFDFEKGK